MTPTPNSRRVVFYIDAYTPETIPMGKLAEYMADFAVLLGRENDVHFEQLLSGSTQLAARVAFEDVPKITTRLTDIRRGAPPKDAVRIFGEIDDRLANDNAIGRIFLERDEGADLRVDLLDFPGRTRPQLPSYGPFNETGSLDGILIAVGGTTSEIPVHLRSEETTFSECRTTRDLARSLAKHLFEPMRVFGTGRWVREPNGNWSLKRFKIDRFEELETASLRDVVTRLRAVRGSGWENVADPLAELADLRNEDV